MKSLLKYIVVSSIMLFSSFPYFSCERDDASEAGLKTNNVSVQSNPEGTILRFLDGTVYMNLTPSDFSKAASVKVTQYLEDECMDMSDCNWIQKMIYIEPLMSFGGPVFVTINYDRNRIDTELELNGYVPVVYYWQNEEDFSNLTRRETVKYDFDKDFKTINFYIKKTGLYAIGVFIPDKS